MTIERIFNSIYYISVKDKCVCIYLFKADDEESATLMHPSNMALLIVFYQSALNSNMYLIIINGCAVRLEKCWFCSSTVYPGHGITFVRNDATVFRFCRSKCHKNFKMKRNPRKVKWTKAYRKLAGKELAEDATFEMERKRNRPEKYDRELVATTVKAMKRIKEIRVARQDRFWEARMAGSKERQRAADRKELEEEIHLVKAPGAMAKDAEKKKVRIVAEDMEQDA